MRVDLSYSGFSLLSALIKLNYLINKLNLRACDVILNKFVCNVNTYTLATKNAREAHPSKENYIYKYIMSCVHVRYEIRIITSNNYSMIG